MRFLTAEWRDLIHLTYEVPEGLLDPLVPKGTTLDRLDGHPMASLVGFRFEKMAVRGWRIPGYGDFEEVNLRFYVVPEDDASKKAVVFIRELVPSRVVAWVARRTYNEPYLRVPMSHANGAAGLAYRWSFGGAAFEMRGRRAAPPRPIRPGTYEEFAGDRHWGYTRQRDGSTLEYQVEHPLWDVAPLADVAVTGPLDSMYGPAWAAVLARPPRSAFCAVGSPIVVHAGTRFAGST